MFLKYLGENLRTHQILKISLISNATLSYSLIKMNIINIQNVRFIKLDERIRMPSIKNWNNNYVKRYSIAKSRFHTKFPALWRLIHYILCNIATFQCITTVIQLINAYNFRFVRTFIISRFLFFIIFKLNLLKLCYNCYTWRLNSKSFAGALYLKFRVKVPV